MDEIERVPARIPELVGDVKTAADVGDDPTQKRVREGVARFDDGAIKTGERIAVDPLHDEEGDVVLLAEIEDLRDVRVLDAGSDPRFVEEHPLELEIGGVLREDCLYGDELLEAVLSVQAR